MGLLLVIVVVVLFIGAMPRWGYSRTWGYRPTGVLGFVLLIVVVMLLLGYLPHRW
jgi:hypothetical protein